MENAVAVANYFVRKSLDSGIPVTPMKLVKLVYVAHGWYLGLTGEPLIAEGVQAWKYGPVVPTVYANFKVHGGNPITAPAGMLSENGQSIYYSINSPELVAFLDKIWDEYKDYSAVELSALTHQEQTPWFDAWHIKGGKDNRAVPIANAAIQSYYQVLASANAA
ncbi:MAG: SocA family protein [Hymenobacter sp.]|nr:SocA family protein [Hymenobacter sp.]